MPRKQHDPSKSLVGFRVGDVAYAVRIEAVREIVNPLEVVALPRAADAVLGVAYFRGEVVPVVDLRERFGLPPTPLTRKNKWIVVDVSRGLGRDEHRHFAALAVDSVTEVFGTGGAAVKPPPALGAGEDVRGIEGVTRYGETLVFVLDVGVFRAIAEAAAALAPPAEVMPEPRSARGVRSGAS